MRTSAAILTCLVFAVPAYAAGTSTMESSGINSVLNLSPSSQDFLNEAAASDQFEIESAQLAQTKGDASDKTFAQHILSDHQKSYSQLKDIDPNAPNALDSSKKKTLDELGRLNGTDFSKQFRRDQINAHKEAISLFRRYSERGDNEQLKSFAAKSLPELERHLQMADALR
jgi:putative membrane protein